jgi:MYXO-CTERM domain-containing protein
MKPATTRFLLPAVAAATLSLTLSAGAATLQIASGTPGGFGRIGGVYTAFSSTVESSVAANWGGAAPVDGNTYSLDTLTLVKNNASGTGFADLWVGIYGSYSGSTSSRGVYGDFLGVSTASVAWSTLGPGATASWSFSGVTATAASGKQLFFALQTSAASLSGLAPINATEGQSSVQRLPGDTNTFTNQGAGIIEAMLPTPAGSEGYLRNTRVGLMSLTVSPVPEPSVAALGALGALGLLRRRRN